MISCTGSPNPRNLASFRHVGGYGPQKTHAEADEHQNYLRMYYLDRRLRRNGDAGAGRAVKRHLEGNDVHNLLAGRP